MKIDRFLLVLISVTIVSIIMNTTYDFWHWIKGLIVLMLMPIWYLCGRQNQFKKYE
jgi:hypothetical protein